MDAQPALDHKLDGIADRVEVLADRVLLYTPDGDAAVAAVHSRGLRPAIEGMVQAADPHSFVIPAVRLDSQAKYAVVARGEADVYLRLPTRADYREKIWDHAGGVLVVEEAGGQVTDIDGLPLDFTHGRELSANRGVVVTNGRLHDDVLRTIRTSSP